MKPMSHPAAFANATRVETETKRLQRTWIKVNGKLECRYEMVAARK